eukprot:5073887-Lingulodinium_polyedra.AAC.1
MIGGALHPAVARSQPTAAAKITGMLLELVNGELMDILESEQRLENAVEAALGMLAAPQGTAAADVNQRPDSAGGAH